MRGLVGIAVAGAAGTLARYGLDGLLSRRGSAFPWGTFAVNVSGSFLLGLLFTVLAARVDVAPWLRSALLVGFLGAYTTFSTLSLDTIRLVEGGSSWLAVANSLGSVAAGLTAVWAGVALGRAI